MSHLGRTLEERFWSKVDKSGSCWVWTASKSPKGYGKIGIKNVPRLAHRVSYELANGPIPDGLMVCHNCPDGDNPACVNPAHLFLGTNTDNVQDMIKKGRAPFQAKTHCVNGHELTPDNIYSLGNSRECRTCRRAASQSFRERTPSKPKPKRTPEQLEREREGKRRRRAAKRSS